MKVRYMINPIELRVSRKNLTEYGKNVPLQDIQIVHLAGTIHDVAMSHRVIFIDQDGVKVLKELGDFTSYTIVDRPVFASYDEVAPYIMNLQRILTNGN